MAAAFYTRQETITSWLFFSIHYYIALLSSLTFEKFCKDCHRPSIQSKTFASPSSPAPDDNLKTKKIIVDGQRDFCLKIVLLSF
jgi:hypothetical protein